ncbi:hypothetical protein [Piscinibacter sp.]|uniref:hypothetical protein n=1 Tax=Piscinibacter sp. TaxID=1903157 RepID=UPI002F3EBA40
MSRRKAALAPAPIVQTEAPATAREQECIMVRTAKPSARKRTPRPASAPAAIDSAAPVIVERPDGYYWQALDGHQEIGPFETYELAQADRDAIGDEAVAPGEALQQAEREIGLADWIDAETGEPAEGESPPHLREE